jgi:hypothetical protein
VYCLSVQENNTSYPITQQQNSQTHAFGGSSTAHEGNVPMVLAREKREKLVQIAFARVLKVH